MSDFFDRKQLGPECEKPEFCPECGKNVLSVGWQYIPDTKEFECNNCRKIFLKLGEF